MKSTEQHSRQCTKCGEVKSFDQFYKSKKGKFGIDSRCIKCFLEKHKTPKAIETRKKYRKTVKYKETVRKHESTEKRKENRRMYEQRTRLKNASRRITSNIRRALRKAYAKYSIKGKSYQTSSVFSQDSLEHLLKTAPSETGYHIDHIIPISVFNVDDIEHLKLAHLPENLRWLSAFDNLSKHNSIDWPLITNCPKLSEIATIIGLKKEEQ